MAALLVRLPDHSVVLAWGYSTEEILAALSSDGGEIIDVPLSEEESSALADRGDEVASGGLSPDAAIWSVVESRCDYALYVGPGGPRKGAVPR